MKSRVLFSALFFAFMFSCCEKEPIVTPTSQTEETLQDRGACQLKLRIPTGCVATVCGIGGTGTGTYTCPMGNVLKTTGSTFTMTAGTGIYTVSGQYVIIRLTGEKSGTFAVQSLSANYAITRELTPAHPYLVLEIHPNSCNAADMTDCLP